MVRNTQKILKHRQDALFGKGRIAKKNMRIFSILALLLVLLSLTVSFVVSFSDTDEHLTKADIKEEVKRLQNNHTIILKNVEYDEKDVHIGAENITRNSKSILFNDATVKIKDSDEKLTAKKIVSTPSTIKATGDVMYKGDKTVKAKANTMIYDKYTHSLKGKGGVSVDVEGARFKGQAFEYDKDDGTLEITNGVRIEITEDAP